MHVHWQFGPDHPPPLKWASFAPGQEFENLHANILFITEILCVEMLLNLK
jgi:hypothetical protein